MSKHNKTYFIVKLSTIAILIALACYMGAKAKDFVQEVQAKKALIDTVASGD